MAKDSQSLDELKIAYDGHVAAMNEADAALANENISGDDYKTAKEQFEAAQAGIDETATKIAAANAEHERARDIQDMRAAAAKRRDEAAKLGEQMLRRPNQKSVNPAEARKEAEGRAAAGDYGRNLKLAISTWGRYSTGGFGMTAEERGACETVGINPASPVLNLNQDHGFNEWARENIGTFRAMFDGGAGPMAGSTDPWDSRDGQFAGILNRPPVQIGQLAVNSYSTNGILRAPVTVMTTDHGENIEQPYFDDMMNTGFKTGENQDVTSVSQGKAGKIQWSAYKYSSGTIAYSWEAMKRFRFDLPDQVPMFLGKRLGRVTGTAFTNASGLAGYPQGIVTFARGGNLISTTAGAGKISVDDIRYLATNSIDHQLIDDPTAVGWMMSRSTWAYLSATKDGEGRPYFDMSKELVNGRYVFSLEGFPIFINHDLPSPAFNTTASQTGTTALLFGDFSKFTVRYAYGSVVPILIRDDVSGIKKMQTEFTAVQYVDSRGSDYGNPPIAVLQMA